MPVDQDPILIAWDLLSDVAWLGQTEEWQAAAARWRDEFLDATPTGHRVKNTPVHQERAVDLAWGLIANVDGSDWTLMSDKWVRAASQWRDQFAGR